MPFETTKVKPIAKCQIVVVERAAGQDREEWRGVAKCTIVGANSPNFHIPGILREILIELQQGIAERLELARLFFDRLQKG